MHITGVTGDVFGFIHPGARSGWVPKLKPVLYLGHSFIRHQVSSDTITNRKRKNITAGLLHSETGCFLSHRAESGNGVISVVITSPPRLLRF